MKETSCFYVYLLRLANGSLYTGYARDAAARLREHRRGTASRCTRSFRPLGLAGCWRVSGGRGSAMRVEWFLKRCPKPTKELLLRRPELLAAQFAARTGREVAIEACRPLPDSE